MMTNKEIIAVHNHYDNFRKQLEEKRNDTLEEVAREFDKMPFGDTSASFAIFVRNMKNAQTKTA
jgi:hypothetical protein